ncbi:MAG: Hsp20/alpha crystallin family protein [Myxococcales bacterium]
MTITVRNEKPIVPGLELPEPMHMLRDLLRWNPFREATHFAPGPTGFEPTFEVRESKDRFVFYADLPGVKESDLEISLSGSRLLFSGTRKPENVEEANETYYAAERTYGAFQRSFTLPEGVDAEHIVAELREGVLTVVVPKLAEMKARKIALKTGPKS